MEFTKEYNLLTGLTKGIRTHWTTMFFIDDDFINGYRTMNNESGTKLYKLSVPLEVDESFSSVLNKVDRLTMIDDSMFIDMSEIQVRSNRDTDSLEELGE